MVKVIVFHYSNEGRLPKLSKEELAELANKFYDALKEHPDVKYNGTFVDDYGRGICEWDAPNVEAVNEVIEKGLGKPPIDGTIAVKRVL